MPYYLFVWNDEVLEHIAEHGITAEEFEEVVCDPEWTEISRSSQRPIAFGATSTGKFIACVYEQLDGLSILPVTSYELE